jgi:shikimate dehydrogenase
MKPLWLLGDDIAGSPSPAMHNAALAALGQPPRYALHPCSPAELHRALDEAEQSCAGVNLTAPHKLEAARRYASILDEEARATGSVNTVVFEGGRGARALNTDVAGLLFAWRRAALHVEGRTVALLGAGGVARSVVFAAHAAGARAVVIHARRPEAAAGVRDVARGLGLEAWVAPPGSPVGTAAPEATLAVVAATALEEPGSWLARVLQGPGAVHDLRYGPRTLAMRDAALRAGHLFSDGTLMLLAQAQAALGAFLGSPLPAAAAAEMRTALVGALRFGGDPPG